MKKNFEIIPYEGTNSIVTIKEKGNYNLFEYTYIQVSADIDTENFTVKEYTFAVVSNPTDQYPRYTSEERCLWAVSPESIEAAKNHLVKNAKRMKSEHNKGKKHPAYREMKKNVDFYTSHYKEDFYKVDTMILGKYNPTRFLWIARESGTEFMFASNRYENDKGTLKYWGENPKNHIFYWNGSELINVTYDEAQKILAEIHS